MEYGHLLRSVLMFTECKSTASQTETPICPRRTTTNHFIWPPQHTCLALGGSPMECEVVGQVKPYKIQNFHPRHPQPPSCNDPSKNRMSLAQPPPHRCRIFPVLQTWKLKLSITKAVLAVFHLNNKETKRELKVNHNQPLPFCSESKYLGVTLDRALTYRHLESLCKKLTSRFAFLRRLAGSGWGAGATTLHTVTLALVHSTEKYCPTLLSGAAVLTPASLTPP